MSGQRLSGQLLLGDDIWVTQELDLRCKPQSGRSESQSVDSVSAVSCELPSLSESD